MLAELPEAPRAAPAEPPGRQYPPPLRGVRAAFVFFSRIPLGGFPYRASDWQWAPAHLPLVGVTVGAACAAVAALGAFAGLGSPIVATLALGTSMWLTGAFHEDGLADSADGLGGAHGQRKRALEIMKDSRIGTYGAVALILSCMLRVACIAELAPGGFYGLVYVHCAARIGPVWLMATEARVSEPEASKSPTPLQTHVVHLMTALGWGIACAALGIYLAWLTWQAALAAAITLAVLALLCARYFRKAVGGVTGDLLGATEQVGEIGAWLALLIVARS